MYFFDMLYQKIQLFLLNISLFIYFIDNEYVIKHATNQQNRLYNIKN